ncbi:MAG: class I SAM-dependent DNA methyltransferase [Candidatus Nealsonbacteria bacterium]
MKIFQGIENQLLPNLYKGKFAELYDLFYEKHWNYPVIASLFEKHLRNYKVKSVLHVGSGPGRLTKILKKKGFQITALDNSKDLNKIFKTINPDVKVIHCDMRKINTKDRFDAIILIGRTFTHLVKDKDIKKALKCFNKVLKDKSVLIFDNFEAEKMLKKQIFKPEEAVKNRGHIITRTSSFHIISKKPTIVRWFYSFEVDGKKSKIYQTNDLIRGFSPEELKRFLNKANFKVLKFAPNFDSKSFITVAQKR